MAERGRRQRVGGFAAFDGQESKCLEGNGRPREAPSPGALTRADLSHKGRGACSEVRQ